MPLNIRTVICYLLMALLLQIYFDCTAYVCLLHHFIVAVHCSHSLRVKWMDVCAKSNELESTSTEKKKKMRDVASLLASLV